MSSTGDVTAQEPAVSVVVPTVGRTTYLEVALRSVQAQAGEAALELIVVADGAPAAVEDVVARHGARLVAHGRRLGLNVARNTGLRAARAPLVAFLDDDIEVRDGWLRALLEGAARYPDAEAFAGPIRARFEQPPPHGCGRDAPLVTELDLGTVDEPSPVAWGANMSIRRAAFGRVGEFDESIRAPCGDEEEWFRRLAAAGGRVVYLAGAAVDHRRAGPDAGLARLSRAAFRRGRAARAFDVRSGRAPSMHAELRTLAGCLWHTGRRRCARGVVMASASAGRVVGAIAGE
jgi:GT2 family glycosyltransferase